MTELVSLTENHPCSESGLSMLGRDDELAFRIIELKLKYLKEMESAGSLIKISSELNITVDQCKQSFNAAFSKFKGSPTENTKLSKLLEQAGSSLDFEYYYENFSNLCRFCCKLQDEGAAFQTIFDDSTDEMLSRSSELIEKIHFTLYENILLKVDFKLSNLICDDCSRKIEDFNAFKRKCDRNVHLLMKAKIALDRIEVKSEADDAELEEETIECLENDDEDLLGISDGDESSHAEEEDSHTKSSDSVEQPYKHKKKLSEAAKDKRNKSIYRGKSSQCPICGKLVKGIQMHLLIHSGERRHKCSYCEKSFTQAGQLKRHINSHLNIRNYKCPQQGCERTFVDPSSVTKHLVVHNKEERKFQCSLCGSRFNRLGALRYHEKTHRQERNHSCNICNKSFLAKYDLTKHYRTHTGEKPYSCKYCDKKFSISKNAKVHLRVHTKEKPYACKFCDLSFAYRSSLKNHLIKIHNQLDGCSLPQLELMTMSLPVKTESDQNDQQVVVSLEMQSHPI